MKKPRAIYCPPSTFAGPFPFTFSGVILLNYWLYILQCSYGTLYTGITTDVERRLAVHRSGKGAKYTRGRGPLTLVYREECGDKSAALRRELEVKALSREKKLALIEGRFT